MKQESQKQKKSRKNRKRTDGPTEGVNENLRDLSPKGAASPPANHPPLESAEREGYSRMIMDWIGDAIHVVDRDLRFLFVNRFFRDWLDELGIESNIVGRTIQEAFSFLPERVLDEYETVIRTRQPLIMEDSTVINGETIITQTRKIPIVEEGEVVRILTVMHNVTERKQAEKSLRESEERYRNLVDLCPDPIVIIQDGFFKFASNAFVKLFGYSLEEIESSMSFLDFLRDEDKETIRQRVEDRFAGKPLSENYRIDVVAKDGHIVPCETSGALIEYEGRPADLIITRDITGRVAAEEALRESEARYRTLFEQAADSVMLIDPDTRAFLDFNDRVHDNLGYSAEEFKRLTIADLEAHLSPDEIGEHIEKVLAEGGDTFETKLRKKDGVIRDYLMNARAIDLHGKTYLSCICRDITERKRAEKALRESEAYNRMLFDNSSIGLALCDMNGKMVDVNPAMARIIGYTVEEMLELTYWELTPDKYAEDEQVQLEIVRNTRQYGPYEKELIHKDGHLVPIRASGILFEKDGESFIWSSVEDITERRQNEETLGEYRNHLEDLVRERTEQVLKLEAEKSMMERLAAHGRVAAGVAHEINNPIASIKSSFLLIKDLVPRDHQYYQYVGRIDREIDRVAHIVNQMFQLYNPKAQEPGSIDMAFLLSDIRIMLEEIIKSADVRIECFVDPGVPQVRLPEGNLRQILSNLLSNAVQATPRGGKILLSAHLGEGKDTLIVKVTDYGEGIPPDIISNIFDPFFTTKDGGTQGGMGLGLSVSQSLAKAMGGEITVESGKENGTIFQLSLPF